MEFFNKIGDFVGDFAKSVGDKTGGMIEITKLKGRIKAENDRIIGLKNQTGELCWRKYTDGTSFDDDVEQLLVQIKDGYDKIAQLQTEIEEINKTTMAAGGVTCAFCGKVNPEGTRFCSECGKNIEASAHVETNSSYKCPDCGNINPAGTKFCAQCGSGIESPGLRLCPSCGTELADDANFCGKCGQKTT